jgi:hypothetical protein
MAAPLGYEVPGISMQTGRGSSGTVGVFRPGRRDLEVQVPE